ncbi:MAG TPA: RHS repeat-associated core domain-containing protein [Bacteroidales bacterium]|nr:RHS repeat-associated core domain-containing protein [Bacteroidales bacterium]HOR82746.1 RHS repeat-associated core domain-containing protein [Bacteroidales bacterium]HPJ91960.1 RHS repeat-associated core domain-containing protein [Bacteroidales bacterium]
MHLTYNAIGSQYAVKQSLPLGGDLEGFYAFNAKELDEENGMYYYSARYYAPPTFISRDPLFEKYPFISPYAYCANNPIILVDPTGMDWYEYTDKDGNTQTMWHKSQNKTYKDGSGNIWNNIGENYLSINGDNATLYTQHKNDKGELYLKSSSYNLADEKSTNRLTSTLGDILSKGSAVAGGLGSYAEGSKATFQITNSKGKFDFRFYGNGWTGNKWVTPKSVSNLGKSVGNLGKMLGGLGILASAYQFRQASTLEGRLEHGLDVFMGGMGFVPVVGTGISLYWSFGGKKLHNMYVNKVLIPQIQMGINPGLPVYQPFK